MRTGPKNEQLRSLVAELKERGHKDKTPLLLRLANDLSKPTRTRRIVNLSRINRFSKNDEVIVVPGKVLATGELDHSVTIAAWTFSGQAKEKIAKANAKAISIQDLLSDGVKGKKIRIFG